VQENIVIIPTYNEKENIEKIILAILDLPEEFHILIIDDSSPDGTADIVRSLLNSFPDKLHLIQRPEKSGLGTAYIKGFKWALTKNYTYIYEMDADFSHNPVDLLKLYHACNEKGADLAIGSRYINGVTVINWPIGRVIISYLASIYVRMFTGMKIMDPTAGFKCYSRKVLETINLDNIKFKGYAFQIEMKFTAWKYGFNIIEVPVIFTDRKEGHSKMTGSIVYEAIWGVIKMKIASYFRTYKK